MKAVVFHQHGALENIRLEDIPAPKPAPGECLVRVRAVSLNGFDPMILRGIPGLRTPMPMIPGADVAGEIVELGSEVDARWKVGDRVAGLVLCATARTIRRRRSLTSVFPSTTASAILLSTGMMNCSYMSGERNPLPAKGLLILMACAPLRSRSRAARRSASTPSATSAI